MTPHPLICKPWEVRAYLSGRKSMVRLPAWDEKTLGSNRLWDREKVIRKPSQAQSLKPGDHLLVCADIPYAPSIYAAGGVWRALRFGRPSGRGYKTVSISNGKTRKTFGAHKLVCMAFYGPPPTPSHQVRHIDGNPDNSAPWNLCWGTQQENWTDRRAHGRGVEGEKHHAAKFDDAERAHIRWAIEKGLCGRKHAARMLGVSQTAIQQLMRGVELTQPERAAIPERIPTLILAVTAARIEKLQEISEEDALREGIMRERSPVTGMPFCVEHPVFNPGTCAGETAAETFMVLWKAIHGDESWLSNPEVVALTVKVHLTNVDAVERAG